MASFSIGEAYGSGFSLMARKPLSVIAWGLVAWLAGMIPLGLMTWLIGPELVNTWTDAMTSVMSGAGAGAPDAEMSRMMALSSKMQSFNALNFLLSIVVAAVINAAVFRAVLRPSDGGLFYMKLSIDEVWQGLLYLCFGILMFIFAVLMVMIGAVLGTIIYLVLNNVNGGVAGLGITFVVLLCFGVILWVSLRFSLAGPATLDRRGFQLFESWTLTKGQDWSLIGLALLLGVTAFAVCLLLGGVFVAAFFALGSVEALSPDSIEAFFTQPLQTWMVQAAPWLIAASLVNALISGAFYAFLLAPFASVYRQLAGETQSA